MRQVANGRNDSGESVASTQILHHILLVVSGCDVAIALQLQRAALATQHLQLDGGLCNGLGVAQGGDAGLIVFFCVAQVAVEALLFVIEPKLTCNVVNGLLEPLLVLLLGSRLPGLPGRQAGPLLGLMGGGSGQFRLACLFDKRL